MLTLPIKAALTVSAAAVLVAPAAAMADPCVGLSCGVGGGGGGGSTGGGGGGGGSDGGGSGGVTDIPLQPGQGGAPGANPGDPPGPDPVQPRISTLDIAAQARASAQLPKVVVHTAPGTKTYVRLRTGLWVDGFNEVKTNPITAGGQTVQATAEPDFVVWDLGETQIQCEDSGGEGTTCGYTYQRSSAQAAGGTYHVKATITWKVSWTCVGDCDVFFGSSDPLAAVSEPQELTVGEIQTGSKTE